MNGSLLIDRSLKALARRVAPTFLRLAGVDAPPAALRWEDVTINLPEYRADQVLLVGVDDAPRRWALHLEFQLEPDRRVMPGWFLKNAALTAQLGRPVILTVLYLTRGRYSRFPATYTATGDGLKNRYTFHTVRLWEHAARIRSGELQELAPLLVLCENTPTEATLREERGLIQQIAPPELRNELLAIALMVGTRYFVRERLLELFREEMAMLKEASVIQEWIEEGEARGRAEGEAREARRLVLRLLERSFGSLPPEVIARVEAEGRDWCEELALRIRDARSLQDLGF
jgi:predicted transposase YdaD